MNAHVIVTAGHRNLTGGGTPGEADRTPRFARAYVAALRESGHVVHYMQSIDDATDGRPDFFSGRLDVLAKRIVQLAHTIDDTPIVMLDLHLEDGASPPGCFVIVPDDPGVAPDSADPAADTWKHNEQARVIGGMIATAISQATGIVVRKSTAPGVMSERRTGVGAMGKRLAMFRHTASLRDRMIRLIIEHGNIKKDLTILDAPDTPKRCGRAVAQVLTTVFGAGTLLAVTAPTRERTDERRPRKAARRSG